MCYDSHKLGNHAIRKSIQRAYVIAEERIFILNLYNFLHIYTVHVSQDHPHPSMRRGPGGGSPFHKFLRLLQQNVTHIYPLDNELAHLATSLYYIQLQMFKNTWVTQNTKSNPIPS